METKLGHRGFGKLRKEADGLTGEFLKVVFVEMFGDPVKNEKKWRVEQFEDVCEKLFAGGDVPKDYFSKKKNDEFKVPTEISFILIKLLLESSKSVIKCSFFSLPSLTIR